MKVIVVASQKGGAGKTTLAINLAVAAEAAGMGPVVVVDTDPQGTLTRWWKAREASAPALGQVAMTPRLPAYLSHMAAQGFNLCVIDTPPALGDTIARMIGVADLIVLPVRPSPADLWAIGGTIDLCRKANRPFVFVVTQATARSGLARQALMALSVHGPVAPIPMHNRVAFASALATAHAAQELDAKGPAAAEVASIMAFVRKAMDNTTEEKAVA